MIPCSIYPFESSSVSSFVAVLLWFVLLLLLLLSFLWRLLLSLSLARSRLLGYIYIDGCGGAKIRICAVFEYINIQHFWNLFEFHVYIYLSEWNAVYHFILFNFWTSVGPIKMYSIPFSIFTFLHQLFMAVVIVIAAIGIAIVVVAIFCLVVVLLFIYLFIYSLFLSLCLWPISNSRQYKWKIILAECVSVCIYFYL